MIDTHGKVINFGKHKGTLWTRVPVSYLRYLINTPAPEPRNNNGNASEIAKAELQRRGSVIPTLEISGHAIDRASLNCRKMWHATALDSNEGIHAWLMRQAMNALALKQVNAEGQYLFGGMKFCFQPGEEFPILKTVIPAR